jgi:hypothetical protein
MLHLLLQLSLLVLPHASFQRALPQDLKGAAIPKICIKASAWQGDDEKKPTKHVGNLMAKGHVE